MVRKLPVADGLLTAIIGRGQGDPLCAQTGRRSGAQCDHKADIPKRITASDKDLKAVRRSADLGEGLDDHLNRSPVDKCREPFRIFYVHLLALPLQ